MLYVGILIFIAVFYCIITEKIPSAWATMAGGLLMTMIGIINQEEVLETVYNRLEILFLLVGMMMIVLLVSETGVFQWFAIKVAQLVRGEPFKLIILLACVTALCSAFLDNVTTILLMAPVSILLAKQLKLNPFPFVITEVMSANIGGLATLIGDPTQLIIGAEGKLTFNEFLVNTAPVAILSMISLLATVYFMYAKNMKVSNELKAKIMELDSSRSLKDIKLLKQSIVIFSLVIIGFILNNFVDKGLAMIALSGAVCLSLLAKKSPKEMFEGVEWETLFFFGGLFVLVEGVDKLGIISKIGELLVEFTDGDLELTSSVVVVLSAILSPILGSVPYTLSFSKIIASIVPDFVGNTDVLWWALSLGACLGGNMTMVGAPANIVGVSIAGKADVHISFMDFFKYGILVVAESVILSIIYINLRY